MSNLTDDGFVYRRLLTDAGADSSQGGYVTLGVTGQVRGSGVGAPAWDVLLSTFPRNRPGNKADAQAEKAWRDATVDSTVGDLGKVDSSMDDADRLKDIRGEGAARPIGTTLELPTDCLLYTSPSPRDQRGSRMPSSA